MKRIIFAILSLFISQSAFADWAANVEEDPITDQKTATMAGAASDGSVLLFKCSEGKPSSVSIIVGLKEKYREATNYAKTKEVIVRVDKGDKKTITLDLVQSKAGNISLLNDDREIADLIPIVKNIATAKQRVAIGLAGAEDPTLFTVSAPGAAEASRKFLKACKID